MGQDCSPRYCPSARLAALGIGFVVVGRFGLLGRLTGLGTGFVAEWHIWMAACASAGVISNECRRCQEIYKHPPLNLESLLKNMLLFSHNYHIQ